MSIEFVTFDIEKDPSKADEFHALTLNTIQLSKDLKGFYKTHEDYEKALKDAKERDASFYLSKPNPTIARSGLYANGVLVCSLHTMLMKNYSNYSNKLRLKKNIFTDPNKQRLYRHASPVTDSRHRGRGYAAMLLKHVLQTYTPAMATHIEPDNKASKALYESVGYRVVGDFEVDYGPKYGVIRMPIWYYDANPTLEGFHLSERW